MSEQDVDWKASSKVIPLSATNDPQQGARLIRAFLRIADPKARAAIVDMVEKMGSAPAGHIAPTTAPSARSLSCRVSPDQLKLAKAAREKSTVHQLAAVRL